MRTGTHTRGDRRMPTSYKRNVATAPGTDLIHALIVARHEFPARTRRASLRQEKHRYALLPLENVREIGSPHVEQARVKFGMMAFPFIVMNTE